LLYPQLGANHFDAQPIGSITSLHIFVFVGIPVSQYGKSILLASLWICVSAHAKQLANLINQLSSTYVASVEKFSCNNFSKSCINIVLSKILTFQRSKESILNII
jgi:hypothetical protein